MSLTFGTSSPTSARIVEVPSAERRAREARAEACLSELRFGRLRGQVFDDDCARFTFTNRAAAVCARALLIEDGILQHVSILPSGAGDRRWCVLGAWVL